MDTATITILSANVRGFRMNVGELTYSFVLPVIEYTGSGVTVVVDGVVA